MEALLLKSEFKADLKQLMELAIKLGINVKALSVEEMEDIGIAHSIKNRKTGNFFDSDEFLERLRGKS